MAQLRERKKAAPAQAISKRTNLNPVLDFKGNVYVVSREAYKPRLSELNKMTLLQFSYDNQYFLFHDRMVDKLIVYELKDVNAQQNN